jgi:phosphoribosylformylglycinamidine cyclo-ligase
VLAARAGLLAAGHDLRGLAHITGGGLPGNVPRALPAELGARLDPALWAMPSIMGLLGALGGIEPDELRATFNGGLGMIAVTSPAAVPAAIDAFATAGVEARVVGEVVPAAELGGRYAEGPLQGATVRDLVP